MLVRPVIGTVSTVDYHDTGHGLIKTLVTTTPERESNNVSNHIGEYDAIRFGDTSIIHCYYVTDFLISLDKEKVYFQDQSTSKVVLQEGCVDNYKLLSLRWVEVVYRRFPRDEGR